MMRSLSKPELAAFSS